MVLLGGGASSYARGTPVLKALSHFLSLVQGET